MTRDEATTLFERVYQQLHILPYNIDMKLMFRHSGGIWKDQLDTWCVEVDDERLKSEEDWRQFKRAHAILETDQDLEEYANAARAEAEREQVMSDNTRQYIYVSESWSDATKSGFDEDAYQDMVVFGLYAPSGNSVGEVAMCWYPHTAATDTPCLECFNSGWHALAQFKDVIDALAAVGEKDITPQAFCQLLERCGFTKRD